jgi:hypothetical protein
MKLTLQAVQVANGHDEEGRLVLADGRLIAVLVQSRVCTRSWA